MPRISTEPLTGMALLIERLYRLTHRGQIRTLVIRTGWPLRVPLDLGPGPFPMPGERLRGHDRGLDADEWISALRELLGDGVLAVPLGPPSTPAAIGAGPEHLSLWCRVNTTAGVDHHRCSGTCDKNHGGAETRFARYPDPVGCGQPCQCEEHSTPCGSAPGESW